MKEFLTNLGKGIGMGAANVMRGYREALLL